MKIPRINSNNSNNSHHLYLFGPLQAFNQRWIFPCLFPSSFIILLLLFFVRSLWQDVQSYTGCHKLSKCCSGDALHWVLKSPIATSSASMTHIGPRVPFCTCAAPFRPRLEYSCKTTAPVPCHTHLHTSVLILGRRITSGFLVCSFIFNLSTFFWKIPGKYPGCAQLVLRHIHLKHIFLDFYFANTPFCIGCPNVLFVCHFL